MLAGELRGLKIDAYICYLPFGTRSEMPSAYQHYGAVVAQFIDEPDSVVIVPEIYPNLALQLKSRVKFIWWLSLSNYYNQKEDSRLRDYLRYLRLRLFRRRPWSIRQLSALEHLCQSETVTDHLNRFDLRIATLTDYINPLFFEPSSDYTDRSDVILYNEKKSKAAVELLSISLPHLRFRGLTGLSSLELRSIYRTSKVFVDFGAHPGRDRMPREAVSQGCILITGLRGTAGNAQDLPIPTSYKIDQTGTRFSGKFNELVTQCLTDYESRFFHDFSNFQERTLGERSIFIGQLKAILDLYQIAPSF